MRISIKLQIILLVVALMTITTVAIIIMSTKNFEIGLRDLHEKLARDALRSAIHAIENEYEELVAYELQTIARRRELMKNISASVVATIYQHHALYQSGLLTEDAAKQHSLRWIQDFRYGNEQYFFVCGRELQGLAHPGQDMVGKTWTGFQDLKLKDALTVMWDRVQENMHDSTVFQWPTLEGQSLVKQLGYFSYYPEWEWMIGTTTRIDDLEKDSQQKLASIVKKLEHIFLTMQFAETGHIFLFDGKGELLIHPKLPGETKFDDSLAQRLKAAAATPEDPIEDVSVFGDPPEQMHFTYVEHFETLDWYVAASVSQQAIMLPASRLAVRQAFLILAILICGLIIAIILSQKITHPLETLTHYARGLPTKNFAAEQTRTLFTIKTNSTELEHLTESFGFMETQLRRHLKELNTYREQLEELVVKRTQELTRANQQLQQEIIERKHTENALRESEERLRLLIESSSNIFVLMDLTGTFLYYKGPQRYGLGPDDLIGKTAEDFVGPETHTQVMAAIEHVRSTGERLISENSVVWQDETLWFSNETNPIYDESGEIIAVSWISRDIARRKQAEIELHKLNAELEQRVKDRTAKLEAANQELQSFAYVVSHDLKAPLRGISRLAYWLKEDYAGNLDEKAQELCELLIGRVKRMDNLIDGILQYSRIGRIKDKIETIDLNRLIYDVIEMITPLDHVQITVESDLPKIRGGKVRISQVFQNLLTNAVKYMDKPEGQVTIGCTDDGTHWKFKVTDNGPGIDPKYHRKVFQIFQTLQPRDECESTGIGLALVKKIVEFYGGHVGIDSSVGQGSVFWFTLPKNSSYNQLLALFLAMNAILLLPFP